MTKEELFTELMNCRNELCLKCGAYRDSHLGACDGCRYNDDHIKEWEKNKKDDHYCNTLSRLYVLDKSDGRIHRIGDDCHDSLCVMNGEIHYHNMQNGDGGTVEDKECYGYVILKTLDGCIGDKDLAAYGYAPDERFIEQIEKYISEQEDDNNG